MRRLIGALVALLTLWLGRADGHDIWISQQARRNPAGEWCCGEGDCFVADKLQETKDGYLLPNGELIPFSEAMPSMDGAFWVCRRPDGTRRCVFAPPPGS